MSITKGWKHSEESKRKMSIAQKGHPVSDEARRNMGLSHLGKSLSEEHKMNIRLSHIGLHLSEETKRKLSEHKRTPEQKEKYRQCKIGEKHWRWAGGRARTGRGYILKKAPDHLFADMNGKVLEHRLVAENVLGRYLKPTEVVHHVNGIKDDNRNCNLVICQDNNYHLFLHRRAEGIS